MGLYTLRLWALHLTSRVTRTGPLPRRQAALALQRRQASPGPSLPGAASFAVTVTQCSVAAAFCVA